MLLGEIDDGGATAYGVWLLLIVETGENAYFFRFVTHRLFRGDQSWLSLTHIDGGRIGVSGGTSRSRAGRTTTAAGCWIFGCGGMGGGGGVCGGDGVLMRY